MVFCEVVIRKYANTGQTVPGLSGEEEILD
jgi:hypothetical protein